jgi:hypothetical protein
MLLSRHLCATGGALLLVGCGGSTPTEPVTPNVDGDTDGETAPEFLYAPAPVPERPPLPVRVRVRSLSVEPDEFRSSLIVHDSSGAKLGRCVRESQPDATPIEGSLVADYVIGSAARVTAVTIRSCDFARAEICECMPVHDLQTGQRLWLRGFVGRRSRVSWAGDSRSLVFVHHNRGYVFAADDARLLRARRHGGFRAAHVKD